MQRIPATLADEHQSLLRPVALRAMAALGAGLRGVVRVHLHHHAPDNRRFVRQKAQQLGVTPARTAAVRLPLLLGTALPAAPFGAFTRSGQFLDADQSLGEGTKDLGGKRVVGISNKPSFPARQRHKTAHGGTGAFLLKRLAGFRVPLRLAKRLLARFEEGLIGGAACHGEIPHPHVHAHHLLMGGRLRVGEFDTQRDKQEVLLLALVVPELARTDFSTLCDVFQVLGVPLVGKHQAALQRGNAHPLAALERVVAPVLVAEGARDELWRRVETLIPAGFGVALPCGLRLLRPRPEGLVRRPNGARDRAGHLSAQPEPLPEGGVHLLLNLGLIGAFAHLKGHLRRVVQRVPIAQRHRVQGGFLLPGVVQLELGGQRQLHRKGLTCELVKT